MLKFIVLLAFIFSAANLFAQDFSRAKYNFNIDWKLFVGDVNGAEKAEFDDSKWKIVTTPNAWNEDEAFRKDIKDLSTGIAWYRKHFTLPANSSNKKVFLEFEGIRQAGEFYLNDKFIGRHDTAQFGICHAFVSRNFRQNCDDQTKRRSVEPRRV